MTTTPEIPPDKKLTVIFRVEAGCLGPQGSTHVLPFCQFAQPRVEATDAALLNWLVCPRNDKRLPEIQYQIAGKTLKQAQAKQYLALFKKDICALEETLENTIATLIGEYQAQLP